MRSPRGAREFRGLRGGYPGDAEKGRELFVKLDGAKLQLHTVLSLPHVYHDLSKQMASREPLVRLPRIGE